MRHFSKSIDPDHFFFVQTASDQAGMERRLFNLKLGNLQYQLGLYGYQIPTIILASATLSFFLSPPSTLLVASEGHGGYNSMSKVRLSGDVEVLL